MHYNAEIITNDREPNDRTKTQKPFLSILIPYYKDDPSDLLEALGQQDYDLSPLVNPVEILIYDDGSQDPALTQRVKQRMAELNIATKAIIAAQNSGRSEARNRLQAEARADWVLFLDADMRPVKSCFLQAYLQLIALGQADVIFGGFTVTQDAVEKSQVLHHALSLNSDCLPLSHRQASGPQHVASSNLCIRKSVLDSEGFDPEFTGWGWEDSEWAARIAARFTLLHVHNPALHLGLETTDTLLRRFATSGANYRRFTQRHPELAKTLSLYKISRLLGKIPGQQAIRPLLKAVIKAHILPIKYRILALKLWRASHYAVALKDGQGPSKGADKDMHKDIDTDKTSPSMPAIVHHE